MTELHIPDEARAELDECATGECRWDEHGPECVDAIARPVLIAELRRLLDSRPSEGGIPVYWLLGRIHELEAER